MAEVEMVSILAALVGCTGGTPGSDDTRDDTADGPTDTAGPSEACTYPEGAVEPMALDEVLYPYAWPAAISRATGERLDLELEQVPCASDPDIDWSPHDVLVFVSIPAW